MSMTPEILQEIISGLHQPYVNALASPQKGYALVTVANQMRMSLWVDHGTLYRMETAECMTQFGDGLWSVDGASWNGDRYLNVAMSRYPSVSAGVKIFIDLVTMSFTLGSGRTPIPLRCLPSELELLTESENMI